MKVTLKRGATLVAVGGVLSIAEEAGLAPYVVRENGRVSVCVPGAPADAFAERLGALEDVESVSSFRGSYPLVSREFRSRDTVVHAGGVAIGGGKLVLIAGPCAVESRDQVLRAAEALKASGAHMLRGGAYKPRSSPYAFQGLREKGLEILAEARERFGLPVVTEVVAPEDVSRVASHADMLQVGSRNMQNFRLLEAVGGADKPVLLKRGMMSTLEEMLQAAEYIVAGGNPGVVLCERGIRTFEKQTRNTLDVTAVPVLKDLSHLPVIVDPSHATGKRAYVAPAALAGVAAGADGLIVEAHPCPSEALCDGAQSLTPEMFAKLARQAVAVGAVVGRQG